MIHFYFRSELQAGMAGQFSSQESSLIFDLADTDGNGNSLDALSWHLTILKLLPCPNRMFVLFLKRDEI